MTSNTTTGERRWASGRRGGMTVLGKVPVPKPINLPSQRSENHGLDPNVEIVPKGTHSWGSRSSKSTNAWSTSTLSPSTDGSSSSPSQLGLRPSSSGGTRPSTAGSEIARDPNNVNTWISNSRPLSASGSSASVKVSLVSLRPRSAETRPGSSQLSRFAESSLDSGAWGPGSTSENIGLGNPRKDGFSLSSGDFPTLGSEKDEPRKNTEPRDDIPRDADPKDGSYNGLQPNTQRCNEEPYPYQNPNIPPYYEPWHGAPSVNPTSPMWYSGPPPYGTPGPFQMDPFPYYLPQVQPPNLAHSHGVGPHGHYASNGDMYRPHHMPESYMHPGMPVGPGFYPGPGPYDGYYGPSMGLCNPNDRDLPFMGRLTGPPVYSKHSHFRPGEFGAHVPHENSMILRKQSDHWSGNEKGILSKAPILDNAWEDNYKNDEDMHFEKTEKVHSRSIEHKVSSSIPTNVEDTDSTSVIDTVSSSEGHALIQKIDCLNVKARSPGVIRDGNAELDEIQFVDSKDDRSANDASLNIDVPFVNATSRELTRGGQNRSNHGQVSFNGKESDGWRKRSESLGEKESQRAKMKEIAKQRALELQKEEEERIRDQKAKALAKLEELNRRSSANNTEENPGCKLDIVPSHNVPKNHTEVRVGPTNHFTNTISASPTNFEPKNEIRVAVCEVKEVAESPNIPFSPIQKKSESETNKLQELPTTVTYDPNPNITEDNISNLNTKSSSIQSKDVTQMSANHAVLSHEDAHTRQNILLKPQYSRKPRSSQGNRSEKSYNNNDNAVWAPVRPHSTVEMVDRTDQKSVDERSSGDDVVDNSPNTKRAEIERYVPKYVDGKHKQRGQGSRSQVESVCVNDGGAVTVKNIETSNGLGKNVECDETLVKGPKVVACDDGWNGPNDLGFSSSKGNVHTGKGKRDSFKGHKGTYSDMNLERKDTKAGSNELLHPPTIETSQKEITMPLKESTPTGDRAISQWKPKPQVSRHNQGAPRDPVAREYSHVDGRISSSGHHENKIDKSIASEWGRNASSNRGFVGRFKKGPESQEDWKRPNSHVEYKPIDSYNRSSDTPNEHGTPTENRFGGMKYKGTGQSQARGGRESFYGRQRGTRADVGNE